MHFIIHRTIRVLSPHIRVFSALILLVVAVLLVACPALVGSIGDGIAFLTFTSLLFHLLGVLFIVNINNEFSLFSKLSW